MSDAANDQNCCIVCGSSQHGDWECKPEQAPREQKIQWFERAWVMINLPVIAVLSRGLSHGLVTEIERLRERAKQNIDAKYEIGRMLGCPEHEELLPWIVRYRDEHKRLSDKITRLRREGNGRMWEQECREKDAEIERLETELLFEMNANEAKGQRIEELESIVIDSSVGMMQAEDTAGKKYCRLQKRIKEQKERLDEEERKKAQQKIDILTGKRISEEE